MKESLVLSSQAARHPSKLQSTEVNKRKLKQKEEGEREKPHG